MSADVIFILRIRHTNQSKVIKPISIRRCKPNDEGALSLVGQSTFLETFADVISGEDILEHCMHQHASEK